MTWAVYVALAKPAYSALSCQACQSYLHSDGVLTRRPAHVGELVERRAGQPTPCATCPKIPPDAPAKDRRYAVEMSDRTRQAFEHYQECAATGHFPDDPLVKRHARLIKAVIDRIEKADRDRLYVLLAGLTAAGGTPSARGASAR